MSYYSHSLPVISVSPRDLSALTRVPDKIQGYNTRLQHLYMQSQVQI